MKGVTVCARTCMYSVRYQICAGHNSWKTWNYTEVQLPSVQKVLFEQV